VLPDERLDAVFNEDSKLILTPDLVGATETKNSGIIGERVDLSLAHTGDVRPSTVLYELTSHLVLTKWRDADGNPKLGLFGQLKRIAKQWIDGYLQCKGGTYPAQLKYKMLADMACEKIVAGITTRFLGERPIEVVLDAFNPTGSTAHVNFNTSKTLRWQTDERRCHINYAILDSDWEKELCRVVENHPRVRSYVKNHNLGLEVPYRYGSDSRKYRPDFIVRVYDGHGEEDLLNLVVEVKGYRAGDAVVKKTTMDTYWIPGVNHLKTYGRWAFVELKDVYTMQSDFAAKIDGEFEKMIASVAPVNSAKGA
jgi:type III restriction enzyme